MTKRHYRYGLRSPNTGPAADAAILDTERAVLMCEPCPPDGNKFHHIATRLDVALGNGKGRTVYERHRRDILPVFIVKHPGCRPPAWWNFDGPTNGPRSHDFYDGVHPPEATHEAQARFLHTRGFLTPEERKKLPREWFAPAPPTLTVIP